MKRNQGSIIQRRSFIHMQLYQYRQILARKGCLPGFIKQDTDDTLPYAVYSIGALDESHL